MEIDDINCDNIYNLKYFNDLSKVEQTKISRSTRWKIWESISRKERQLMSDDERNNLIFGIDAIFIKYNLDQQQIGEMNKIVNEKDEYWLTNDLIQYLLNHVQSELKNKNVYLVPVEIWNYIITTTWTKNSEANKTKNIFETIHCPNWKQKDGLFFFGTNEIHKQPPDGYVGSHWISIAIYFAKKKPLRRSTRKNNNNNNKNNNNNDNNNDQQQITDIHWYFFDSTNKSMNQQKKLEPILKKMHSFLRSVTTIKSANKLPKTPTQINFEPSQQNGYDCGLYPIVAFTSFCDAIKQKKTMTINNLFLPDNKIEVFQSELNHYRINLKNWITNSYLEIKPTSEDNNINKNGQNNQEIMDITPLSDHINQDINDETNDDDHHMIDVVLDDNNNNNNNILQISNNNNILQISNNNNGPISNNESKNNTRSDDDSATDDDSDTGADKGITKQNNDDDDSDTNADKSIEILNNENITNENITNKNITNENITKQNNTNENITNENITNKNITNENNTKQNNDDDDKSIEILNKKKIIKKKNQKKNTKKQTKQIEQENLLNPLGPTNQTDSILSQQIDSLLSQRITNDS